MDLLVTTKKELLSIVENSRSKKEVLLKYGRKGSAGDYRTLNNRLKKFQIECNYNDSHNYRPPVSDKDLFVKGCKHSQQALRRRVLKNNLILYKCAICGQEPLWNNKKLTLTLDHINGDHYDNRIENLRFICPNCDSQQSTYCSRNIKKEKKKVKKKTQRYCECCGKELKSSLKRVSKCRECYNINRSEHIPSSYELIEEFLQIRSFLGIGRKHGVSENAVKKWFKKYNLPWHKKELVNYLGGYLSERSKELDCKSSVS